MSDELSFNNSRYRVRTILANLGPVIVVNKTQLNSLDSNEYPEGAVTLSTPSEKLDEGTVVIYKQQGKYTVLLGRGTVSKAAIAENIVARLISGPALKKARVEVLTAEGEQQLRELQQQLQQARNKPHRSFPPRERSYGNDNRTEYPKHVGKSSRSQ